MSWTGLAGDNNWDSPGNWSNNSIPGSSDDVTINIAADVVHSSGAADAVHSLTSSEPLTISFGSLAIANPATLNSTLTMSGGTLTASNSLDVSGLLTLTSGTISGSGTINSNGGILINPSNNTVRLDGCTLINPSGQTATWTGTNSNIQEYDGHVFDNKGTFLAQNDGQFTQGTSAQSTFVNSGSFTKQSDTANLVFGNVPFNVTGGSVDVKAGDLSLGDGGTDSGASFTVETGAELDLGGGHSVDATSTISGPGTVKFISSTSPSTIAGTYDVTGETETQSSGIVNFTGPVQSLGSTFLLNGGTLNFNSPFNGTAGTIPNVSIIFGTANFGANTLNLTTLDLNGGTLQSTADINVSGMTTLSAGTISGSGNVNANGGTLINPMNDVVRIDGRTFNNPAGQTATWTGTNSNIQEYDGTIFDNMGTFLAENDGQFSLGTGAKLRLSTAAASPRRPMRRLCISRMCHSTSRAARST